MWIGAINRSRVIGRAGLAATAFDFVKEIKAPGPVGTMRLERISPWWACKHMPRPGAATGTRGSFCDVSPVGQISPVLIFFFLPFPLTIVIDSTKHPLLISSRVSQSAHALNPTSGFGLPERCGQGIIHSSGS